MSSPSRLALDPWPTEYGGRGGTLEEELVFLVEHFREPALRTGSAYTGATSSAPRCCTLGTDEQKARFLPRIMRCEDMWGQGFSEPEAGSDLGGVRTRAELDGDEWVLNGQKIWMTFGTRADWLYVLCRTDPDAPKHRGLSLILVPADQPGVDIRPIRNLADGAEFAEVFFNDARTDADLVVGPVDGAWSVVMGTVGHRTWDRPCSPYQAAFEQQLHDLVVALRTRGRRPTRCVRQRLAPPGSACSSTGTTMRGCSPRPGRRHPRSRGLALEAVLVALAPRPSASR